MRKIVDWACELFGLKATTHLRDYCNVHMPQLQSSGRHKHYVYIKSLVHDFNEILRLNGVEFHGNKLIAEIVKTPLRTIYSNNTWRLCQIYLLSNHLTQLDQTQINQ